MEKITFILFLFIANILTSQIRAPKMTEEFKLEYGQKILENTTRLLSRSKDTTYADYWNLALAHCLLSEDIAKVEALLLKSKAKNNVKFQGLIDDSSRYYGSIEKLPFHEMLGKKFIDLMETKVTPDKAEIGQNVTDSHIPAKQLNIDLKETIKTLSAKDQKYRSLSNFLQDQTLIEKQRTLDDANSEALYKICKKHGYPGISLVGSKFASNAAVIMTHTNKLEVFSTLFPYALKAYQNEDLSENIFILLVDRYHWRMDGKQIFGTQPGVPFYEENQIKEFKKRYLIDYQVK
ncbi:hypothetical protein [Flagellimonas zhangzhouensis]|uniref:Uncharacterized protein n=2 Tax=Flagellimonas zhangzhouensis TaxID=1073328 RepID=A0A1H2SXQ1_9FLAO|nr:hypothetical protein [Allomuricauda zhangzhouensis]SDQ81099.1 hypothetical protein SAMN05216294_2693 [Allomuricauda zhangzhouensis]SDW36463.1 hypothetical protein SAMN04487892_1332 [Allomuricauda zhangzhouensis]